MKIAITSLKGGVGKTTISTNLAVCFAQKGYKVCIIDTDAEQESSISWSEQRLDHLVSVAVVRVGEKTLIREVKAMEKNYDIILLDGSPQLKELASATIAASDLVIIPISPSAYDFWALDFRKLCFQAFIEFFSNVLIFIEFIKQNIRFKAFFLHLSYLFKSC